MPNERTEEFAPRGILSSRHISTGASPLPRSSSDFCSIIRSRSRGFVTTSTAGIKAVTVPRYSSALSPQRYRWQNHDQRKRLEKYPRQGALGPALEILTWIRHVWYASAFCIISELKADLGYFLKSCNARSVSSPGEIRVFGTHPALETGVFTDYLVYSLIIPVVPYQLITLGYDNISSRVSWLLVAFVRLSPPSNRALLIRSAVVRGTRTVDSSGSSPLRGLPQS